LIWAPVEHPPTITSRAEVSMNDNSQPSTSASRSPNRGTRRRVFVASVERREPDPDLLAAALVMMATDRVARYQDSPPRQN
jgi:uncharacterized MAPEG superfamily protein